MDLITSEISSIAIDSITRPPRAHQESKTKERERGERRKKTHYAHYSTLIIAIDLLSSKDHGLSHSRWQIWKGRHPTLFLLKASDQ